MHGRTTLGIAVPRIGGPQFAGRIRRPVEVHQQGLLHAIRAAAPTASAPTARAAAQHHPMAVLEKREGLHRVRRLVDFLRLASEWRLQRQNMLRTWRRWRCVRALRAPAASTPAALRRGTDRLHPEQRRRFVHAPLQTACPVGGRSGLRIVRRGCRIGSRTGRLAAPPAAAQRQARHMMHSFAGAVPNVHFRRELRGRIEVREGPMNAGDQEIAALGRGPDLADHGRLADGRSLAGERVHQHELRGGQILEVFLVMRGLEHVLVGHHAASAAQAFLDVRPRRHGGLRRFRPAIGLDGLDQQRLAVRQPLYGGAGSRRAAASTAGSRAGRSEHVVHADAFQPVRPAGGRLAHPDLDSLLCGVGKHEVLAIRAPARGAQFRIGWQRDFDLGPFGHLAQRQRAVEGGVVQPISQGVDADPREAPHGLGQFRDGRIPHRRSLHGVSVRGVQRESWGGGSIQNVQDHLGRFPIAIRAKNREGRTDENKRSACCWFHREVTRNVIQAAVAVKRLGQAGSGCPQGHRIAYRVAACPGERLRSLGSILARRVSPGSTWAP